MDLIEQYGPMLLRGFGITVFCWIMGTILGMALALIATTFVLGFTDIKAGQPDYVAVFLLVLAVGIGAAIGPADRRRQNRSVDPGPVLFGPLFGAVVLTRAAGGTTRRTRRGREPRASACCAASSSSSAAPPPPPRTSRQTCTPSAPRPCGPANRW